MSRRSGQRSTSPAPVVTAAPRASDAFPRPDGPTWLIAVAVGLAAGAVYVTTAARDVVFGDTPEFITAAASLGVAHPPGYPVLTLLGHLFASLPIGPLPLRVNLVSVAAHAGTVSLTYALAARLSGSRAAALVAAALLAFGRLFWEWSLVAEAFPLNDLLAALTVLLTLTWSDGPERGRFLVAAAFTTGLGLANHLTIALLAPAILYLLWLHRDRLRRRPSLVVASAGALLLGLLPYAYLPLAARENPPWNWGAIASVSDFTDHLLRRQYGSGQLLGESNIAGGEPLSRVLFLFGQFGIPYGLVAVVGAFYAFRRLRWYFWFILLAFLFTGPLFAAYANANLAVPLARSVLERFFLLSYVVVAPLSALGARALADAVFTRARVSASSVRAYALTAAGVAAGLGGLVVNYAVVDKSANHVVRAYVEDIFATLEDNAILLTTGDAVAFPVAYFQVVEKRRPDVALVVLPLLPLDWYPRYLRTTHPELVIPFSHYDGETTTLRALVEANPGRPVSIIGPLSDRSLESTYQVYARGVTMRFERKGRAISLATFAAENEKLYALYRMPRYADTREDSWERVLLVDYAVGSYRVGRQFETERRYAEARVWYQRALEIHPGIEEPRTALARLPK